MSSTITIRGIDPRDKEWLRCQAKQCNVSIEQVVHRLIREGRERTEKRPLPSEVFQRHFGPEHGVELPLHRVYGCKPVTFTDDA